VIAPKATDWKRRIGRARELAEQTPARELLHFYVQVLAFQERIYDTIATGNDPGVSGGSLRDFLRAHRAERHVPALLALVKDSGPPKLSHLASNLQAASPGRVREILDIEPHDSSAEPEWTFFARVVCEPYAERLAQVMSVAPREEVGPRCPLCDGEPQVAVIRPEGDGGKRSLVCSLCHTEWEFRRILCPACGEEHNEKLPRYSAPEIAAIRVEGCDTCKCYLKSVDLTVDGFAVPLVDEVGAASLDLWAVEKGYSKIHLNIIGF
jgi:FdhE protein